MTGCPFFDSERMRGKDNVFCWPQCAEAREHGESRACAGSKYDPAAPKTTYNDEMYRDWLKEVVDLF